MKISIDDRWRAFIDAAVTEGRYGSADDVVGEGLRLLAARDAKLADLRRAIADADALGGENSDDDVAAMVQARLAARRTALS
ncbi:MAG TPA: type II toxin-antitoxin system ParD family antitoxin [Azospirillaceae bacterium]|nr:type II toxin-antitoxin system ParD family antitoxin [Azospirillaceae bacterium]HRQ82075.1 type II toxin-antitoxin system ParD family antitoxin [Azospirillaceae bacterium]